MPTMAWLAAKKKAEEARKKTDKMPKEKVTPAAKEKR